MKRKTENLVDIMELLRNPERGCPWDSEQTFSTIIPYTIEEAYEVLDAIEKNDMNSLKDELGDLLLQVVYHARMAEEKDFFNFDDVVEGICLKMIRRHPHIFGTINRGDWASSRSVWEDQKATERKEKKVKGVLDGVAPALPALMRAFKLQSRAARVGFDWDNPEDVFAKIKEETNELEKETIEKTEDKSFDRIEDEMGDLLFAVANLARKLEVDPEKALRRTNAKFEKRFSFIEKTLAETGRKPEDATLEEMEDIWQQSKKH